MRSMVVVPVVPPLQLPEFPFLRVPLLNKKWIAAPYLDFRQRVRATCLSVEPTKDGSAIEEKIEFIKILAGCGRLLF